MEQKGFFGLYCVLIGVEQWQLGVYEVVELCQCLFVCDWKIEIFDFVGIVGELFGDQLQYFCCDCVWCIGWVGGDWWCVFVQCFVVFCVEILGIVYGLFVVVY